MRTILLPPPLFAGSRLDGGLTASGAAPSADGGGAVAIRSATTSRRGTLACPGVCAGRLASINPASGLCEPPAIVPPSGSTAGSLTSRTWRPGAPLLTGVGGGGDGGATPLGGDDDGAAAAGA